LFLYSAPVGEWADLAGDEITTPGHVFLYCAHLHLWHTYVIRSFMKPICGTEFAYPCSPSVVHIAHICRYLEDCREALPAEQMQVGYDAGFKPYVYNEEGAKKLWEVSAQLTGVEE
jgi:hypothetical protein